MKTLKIVNPIYDAAFKYLLEDTEIAKGLIGYIIGEEIVELSLKPQELHFKSEKYVVIIMRIDFKATIKTKLGEYKKVIIEIQKGKHDDDILRFRKYLGSNYRKQDEVKDNNGVIQKMVLPIISIYFLGFRLQHVPTPVVKANREYVDLVLNQELKEKEPFIEKLTHDGYFIQIPRLHQRERNELEGILKVFNQSYKLEDDGRLMKISEKELNKYPLLKKIGDRLFRATADEDILDQMEAEEEVEEKIEKVLREAQEQRQRAEKLAKLAQKEKQRAEKQAKLAEEEKQRAEKQTKLAEEEKQRAEKQTKLAKEEKQRAEELEEKVAIEKRKTIEQLILYTDLSDEKIAILQDVTIKEVREIRAKIE